MNCSSRWVEAWLAGGFVTRALLYQQNYLLQIRPTHNASSQGRCICHTNSNNSSNLKDLALGSIPLLHRNQSIVLVSKILYIILVSTISATNSSPSVIPPYYIFKEKSKFLFLTSNFYPNQLV